MASVSTYLNFPSNTEEAFNFYKAIFGTEFEGDISRMDAFGQQPGQPEMSEADKKLIMHIALPITAGHIIHGTDASESMGFSLKYGNNMYISVDPETREECERLFKALSDGGEVSQELADMPWGDYFGSFKDKYGVQWMFNCTAK
jgi:PhnB protein